MKAIVAGLLLLGLSLMPSWAAADEKAQLAEKVMVLTNMDQTLEHAKQQVLHMQARMMDQFDVPAEKNDEALAFQNRIIEKTFEVMSFNRMHDEYVKLFTDVYTVEELRGMVSFYESPVGRSMVEKQPIIINRTMTLTQERMKVLIPELNRMAEEFRKSLHEK